MTPDLEMMRVRIHEAGHAATAMALGLAVEFVTISDDGGGCTGVRVGRDLAGLILHAIVAAAGITIDRQLGVDPTRHADDLDVVIVAQKQWIDTTRNRPLPDVFALAAETLKIPAVSRFAARLYERLTPGVTVKADELRTLFAECGGTLSVDVAPVVEDADSPPDVATGVADTSPSVATFSPVLVAPVMV